MRSRPFPDHFGGPQGGRINISKEQATHEVIHIELFVCVCFICFIIKTNHLSDFGLSQKDNYFSGGSFKVIERR